MPTYQYECDACHYQFEVMQAISDPKLKKCSQCGKLKLHRHIGSGSGIIFKGNGFYETDYKRKSPSTSSTCPAKDTKKDHGGGCSCCPMNQK